MATRPASTKKAAPAKKAVGKEPAPAAPKPKAVAVPVVTLRAVFEQLAKRRPCRRSRSTICCRLRGCDNHEPASRSADPDERPRHAGSENAGRANGPHPATGEAILIKASKKVVSPAKELKETV